MLFATKLITISGNIILNICDPELLDKTVKNGTTEIKIHSNYYNENIVDEIEATKLLDTGTSANLVGEKTISLSIKNGLGSENGVRKIDGTPFLIVFKV